MNQEAPNESVGWDESLGEHASNPPTPRQTGERLFALGQEWFVSPDEARIKAQFEDWLKAGAQRAIYETLRAGDFDEADRQRAAFIAARAAGAYTWEGKANRAARSDKPGICQLLFLMMRRCRQPNDREVTDQLVLNIAEDNWAGVLQTVALALGNWKTPASKQPTPQKQPPLTQREVASGSAWTGEKSIRSRYPSAAEALASQTGEPAPYSEAQIRRAMEYLATQEPASSAE